MQSTPGISLVPDSHFGFPEHDVWGSDCFNSRTIRPKIYNFKSSTKSHEPIFLQVMVYDRLCNAHLDLLHDPCVSTEHRDNTHIGSASFVF